MSTELQPHIDWNYSGKPDEFFGTGATTAERSLVWGLGLLGTALITWTWWTASPGWAWWQYAIALLLTLDVIGGVTANALNSCKRFYHAPLKAEETGIARFAKNHLAFTLLHIHPILIGLIFGSMNWAYGLFWYVALVGCVLIILRLPLYLQRPAALGLIMIAILLNYYFVAPVVHFEWFIPALFLKIVYGHTVREEPYRPS